MLPKLGLVSIGIHDDILNWVAKYKPVSIIVVNERGQARPERPWENNEIDSIRKAMSASPKTLWIFRSWPDGIGEGERALAFRMMDCFSPFMDMPNPLMAHSYNEPGFPWIRTSGDARQLMYLEKDFALDMQEFGVLSMNFCFSESHILKGNMGLWEIYAEALPYVDALGFNEYDWPWEFASRDQGYKWRIGHWEHQVERIRRAGIDALLPPIIIGEGILDGKIKYPNPFGWQKRWSPKIYVEQHQAAHNDTYHKPEVFAHHTFCYCHPASEWRSYSVKPILAELGSLIKGQVYWEDFVYPREDTPDPPNKEEEMGVWKDVPENIARWRPLIEKVTSSFHVPIPDYNGIHVSPAKVVTCIIRIESNGDPGAVGGAGHAHGLMQVWKDHHPGKNLFDPEVNIRTGLEILKAKLAYESNIDIYEALYFYSGGSTWSSAALYTEKYWEPFVKYYKQFWGVDLGPTGRIQEALEGLARIDGKLDGIDYLVKQVREEKETIEEKLS